MKVKELIEKLELLPPDDEIGVLHENGTGDYTLGLYSITSSEGIQSPKGQIYAKFSNYIPEKGKKIKYWELS